MMKSKGADMKREIVRNRTPAFEDQSQEGREEMENM
jgi:hypothetical protein